MSISWRELQRGSAESPALATVATGPLSRVQLGSEGDLSNPSSQNTREVLDSAKRAWMKGMSPEDRSPIDEFYRQRYGTSKV